MPLTMLAEGAKATVEEIRGKDDARKFLENIGFVKGAQVAVVTVACGNLIVSIKQARVAVSRAMAGRIFVRAA